MNLREIIGHSPIQACACGCLIFNEKKQILLQLRSDDNLWGNPGGAMELGETIYDTVKRELKEETGISLNEEDLKLFNIYSGESEHHIYPNNDEVYYVNIVFEAKYKNEEIIIDNESLDLKFFDIDKIPNNITDSFKVIKKDILKRKNLENDENVENVYKLIYNYDILTKEKLKSSYEKDNFATILDKNNILILKKSGKDDYINKELEENIVYFFDNLTNSYLGFDTYHEDISDTFKNIKKSIAPREYTDKKDLTIRWNVKNTLRNIKVTKEGSKYYF